jgi:hypothetical protein
MAIMERKAVCAFALLVLLSAVAFAQQAPDDPLNSPAAYEETKGLFGSLFDSMAGIIGNSLFPLPKEALMHTYMCAPTGNSLLDIFAFNPGILSLSALAAAAGVLFISFIFMLGKLMDNKKWVEYARSELFEIGITVLVVLVLLVPIMKVIGCYNPFEPGISTYQAAFAYPKDILSSVSILSVALYIVNGCLQKLVLGIEVVQSVWVQASGGLGSGGDDATFGTTSNAGMIVVVVSGLASLMAYLHELVTYGFVAYLLPLGLALRFFAPTRRIGGTMIALTFGMGILVPFMFAIGHSVIAKNYFPLYYDANPLTSNKLYCMPLQAGGHLCFGLVKSAFQAGGAAIENVGSYLSGKLAAMSLIDIASTEATDSYVSGSFGTTANGEGLYETPAISGGQEALMAKTQTGFFGLIGTIVEVLLVSTGGGILCFGGTIYPLIVSVVLISGVKYMSSTLGEEIDVTNLTRLI